MSGPPRSACGICHEADIPTVGVQWLWWSHGKPIHPWCDRATWQRITFFGRRGIRKMVDRLMAEAAALS